MAIVLFAVIALLAAVADAQLPEATPTPSSVEAAEKAPTVRAEETSSAEPTSTAPQVAAPLEAVEIGGVESRTAAMLLSGQTGGNLPGVMLLCQEAEATDAGLVPLRLYLELDGSGLLEAAPEDRVPVAVYVYVLNEAGAIVGHLGEGVIIRGPSLRTEMHRGGLKFEGRLEVPPGTVSVRALARLYGTGRFLLTRTELRIVAPGSGEPSLSPLLFPEPDFRWVEVRQQGLPPGGCVNGLVPSAMPVLDVSREMGFDLAGEGWPQGAHLQIHVVDLNGREVQEPSFEFAVPDTGTQASVWIAHGQIEPFDVPSGEYRLIAALRAPNGDELATTTVPAVLLPIPAAAPWAGIAELGEQPEMTTPSEPPAEPASVRKMRAAYRAALELLATGDDVGARRAVAELERSAFAADPSLGLFRLQKEEVKTASRLARKVPTSLPPVVLLHRDMYRTYKAFQESALATHAWKLAADLAELAGKERGPREVVPEDFAPGVLVSLASELADGASDVSARSLLQRVTGIDSRYAPALLGLAALDERNGHPGDAVDTLRRLVDIDPDNAEGRLRLGVDLARIGRRGASSKVLSDLVAGSPPDWVLVVATQELARVQIVESDLNGARQTLTQGISRQPENQRLKIMLAYLEDLTGQSAQAAQTIAGIEDSAGRRFDTPRLRYSEWPDLGLFTIRARLEKVSDERRVDLREALGLEAE